MSQTTPKKLDYLMRLTGTQNNTLAKAVAFDASYISRLRLGKRKFSEELIFSLATYFAKNIASPEQQKTLHRRICPGESWPEAIDYRIKLIADWLSESGDENADYEGDLLATNTGRSRKEAPFSLTEDRTEFFFGNAGKRQGVEKFLTELCEKDSPANLLLHSDEPMEWMYEDDDFINRWGQLLHELTAKGGKIKIVHTVRRNFEEMIHAIKKWVPIYMTGRIETYYCPRLRDSIYRRTLFIAQKHSALVSHSIGETKKAMVNLLIRDKAAVNALEDEFYDYLSLCQPLVKIFGIHNVEDFLHTYALFTRSDANTIMLSSQPSRCTMPESVNESMAARIKHPIFRQETAKLRSIFTAHLAQGYQVTEILCLPDPQFVKDGSIPLPFRDLLGQPELTYTAEEFARHLTAAADTLEKEPNYHVIIPPACEMAPFSARRYYEGLDLFADGNDSIMLMVKENAGVFMHNIGKKTVALFTGEADMVRSFWDYLSRLTMNGEREQTIKFLRDYVKKIGGGIKRR